MKRTTGNVGRLLGLIALVALVACRGDSGEPETRPDPGAAGPPLLVEITEALGLPQPEPWPDGSYYVPEITGAGVGVFDYDADGDLDILQVRAPPPGQRGAAAPNRLFRQEPDGRFADVTAESGLGDPGFGQGVALGDVDNDGDPDVFVGNYGPDSFYLNNGDGTFRDATADSGLSGDQWSTSAAFCDYDRDGNLDLFVTGYVRVDYDGPCRTNSGAPEYCGPKTFEGVPDVLYRNRGDGTFQDVTSEAGITLPSPEEAKGLGVLCIDLTADGWADIYVANDGEANQLWVNRGDGTFRDESLIRGVAFNRHGRAEASMGITAGDVDADGRLDLFMTHLKLENNTLYTGGDRLYQDRTVESQLSQHDLPYTGFGCGLFDMDHDGDLDLAVVNGEVRQLAEEAQTSGAPFWERYAQPNLLMENLGAGRFEDAGARAESFTGPVRTSRGLAFGDLDRDGDLDLFLTDIDNSLRVYRNDAPLPGSHWLLVRALSGGRDALGAEVRVTDAGGRTHLALIMPGYSFLSSNDPRAHFGLGNSERVTSIEVAWPDGTRERFDESAVDREVTLVQGSGAGP